MRIVNRYFAKSFFILSAVSVWWNGSDTFFLVSLWFLYYQHIINIIMWMIVIEMAIIVVVKLSGLRDSLGFCCLAIFSTRWWGVSYIKFRFKLNIQFGITRREDCIFCYLDLYLTLFILIDARFVKGNTNKGIAEVWLKTVLLFNLQYT